MWALIVLSIMAGSATGKSSMPILYSGVTIQDGFKSEQSCEDFKKTILEMNNQRDGGPQTSGVRDGIIAMKCKKM